MANTAHVSRPHIATLVMGKGTEIEDNRELAHPRRTSRNEADIAANHAEI